MSLKLIDLIISGLEIELVIRTVIIFPPCTDITDLHYKWTKILFTGELFVDYIN